MRSPEKSASGAAVEEDGAVDQASAQVAILVLKPPEHMNHFQTDILS